MESSTPKFREYRTCKEESPEQIPPIPRETSPLQVDPDIFVYNVSGADDEPADLRKNTEVSNEMDHMVVTPKNDDSSTTEGKTFFNTTKVLEEVLKDRGIIKRTVSESEINNRSLENIFYGKMKTRAPSRSRSLADLVGEMTINGWNSDCSFEKKSNGTTASNGGSAAYVGHPTGLKDSCPRISIHQLAE